MVLKELYVRITILTYLCLSAMEAKSVTHRSHQSTSRRPCLQTPPLNFVASVARAQAIKRIDIH